MNEPLFERAWREFLDADPDDPDRRLVTADWLDEQGDAVAAACVRWAVSAGRSPNHCTITGTFDWWRLLEHRVGVGWKGETRDRYPTAGLPPDLYRHVYQLRDYTSVDNFIPADTRFDAEVLLVAGWRRWKERQ